MDLTRITAVVDALIGGLMSVFSKIYNRLTGHQPTADEVEVVVDEEKLKKRRIISIVATFVIFGSLSSIFFTECERTPRPNMAPMIALGNAMGRETARMIENKGGVVLVVMDTPHQSALSDVQIKAFLKNIGEHGEITLLGTEKVSMTQGRPLDPNGFSSELFFSILEKYPKAAAIVSFMGPPNLTDEDIEKLPQAGPKIAVTSFFPVRLKKLFDAHVLHLAITRRMMRRPTPASTVQTPQEQFDQQYEIITTDNASDLMF